MRLYAGIGSRKTPDDVLDLMQRLAAKMALKGWVLRSGHAPGADQAFERGCHGIAEIYLPWPGYEKDVPHDPLSKVSVGPTMEAIAMASTLHPAWMHIAQGPRKLMARNCHQILGRQLNVPVERVVCWTPDGSLDGESRQSGGTGQALRLAVKHHIRVINLQRDDARTQIEQWLNKRP